MSALSNVLKLCTKMEVMLGYVLSEYLGVKRNLMLLAGLFDYLSILYHGLNHTC